MRELITALAIILAQAPAPRGVTGHWKLTMDPDFRGNPATVDCQLKQDANKVVVKCDNGSGGGSDMAGAINGRTITWRTPPAPGKPYLVATWTGEIDQAGVTITGTWHFTLETEVLNGKFKAKKQN
jgi:hypothetical protein